MDFKGWRVKSADGKKAVLMHDKGHFMSIAMKSLSRAQQAQIQHLAGGGSVHKETMQPGVSKAGALVRANEPDDMGYAKDIHKRTLKHLKADKGKRTNLADGGPVLDPEKTKQFEAGFGGKPAPQPTPQPKPQNYDDGGVTGRVFDGAGAPVQAVPAQPQSTSFPSGQGLMLPDNTLNAPAAVGMEQQAIQEQADVDAEKARRLSLIEGQTSGQLQQLYNGPAAPNQLESQVHMYNGLKQHTDEFRNYVEEHDVNPQHFQESMGSGRKANAAIGLMLGGMAGGLSGTGGNVAMDFLNKQIDRDIDAQKANINNRHTVLGAYQHLYGEGVVAQNMAKASMLDIYAHKVQNVADDLGTRQAHANAMAFKARAAMAQHQLLLDSSGRLGQIQVSGGQQPQGQPSQQPTNPSDVAPLPEEMLPGDAAPPHVESILHEGADKMYQAMPWSPQLKGKEDQIHREYEQAVQADKALAELPRLFTRMAHETNGASGRIHRGLSPHVLGAIGAGVGTAIAPGIGTGVGAGIGEGVGHLAKFATNTAANRAYDADRASLFGLLSGSLKGTNVTGEQMGEAVDKFAAESGDASRRGLLQQKLEGMAKFIRDHTVTGALDAHGFTRRGRDAMMKKRK